MPFKPSNDPQKWQGLYTEKQAHEDSMGKDGQLTVLPFFAVAFSIFYIVLLLGTLKERPEARELTWQEILGVASVSLVFYAIGRYYIFQSAAKFIQQFHNLNEENDLLEIVKIRVSGVPLMPPPFSKWIKFQTVTAREQKLDPPNHWATIIGGPVKLVIKPGHALYLEHLGQFSRVVGQGAAFLHWDERVAAVLDVGPKTEEIELTAWTKDGIRVKLRVRGEYFLGQERSENDENKLIPFDPVSVRKAVEHTYKNGKETSEWVNFATGQTQGILGGFISRRYLDQLFLKEHSQTTLLSNANIMELSQNINEKLQEYGVSLLNLQIMEVELPPKVNRLRKLTWETAHKNTTAITKGEVAAHRIRLQEKARAEMQRDLILTLANGLNRIDSASFPENLLLTVSGFLDQSMQSPEVRSNLAREALETLEKLQEAIKFPMQMPGNNS
ncbi:MAG: hypothetical protein C4557_12550 [Anaerolineaceae bacterium]|jgi:hypothetical protein|nr:MAG: hypothetical protein C4557_12550 [Anaerolineaceae bacterium]